MELVEHFFAISFKNNKFRDFSCRRLALDRGNLWRHFASRTFSGNGILFEFLDFVFFPTLQSGVVRFKVKSAGSFSSFSFFFSRHSRNSRYTRPLKLQLPSMAHLRKGGRIWGRMRLDAPRCA